jgi:hypothetical protein
MGNHLSGPNETNSTYAVRQHICADVVLYQGPILKPCFSQFQYCLSLISVREPGVSNNIDIKTHRHIDRQTNRWTERHIQRDRLPDIRQKGRQTCRQKDRHTDRRTVRQTNICLYCTVRQLFRKASRWVGRQACRNAGRQTGRQRYRKTDVQLYSKYI